MAVLVNAYDLIGEPHRRTPACSSGGHVVAISSNEMEDDAAVGDLIVGMCYGTEGEREFGYWANDNASRFHDALTQASSELPVRGREPFYELLDSDPLQATFGPASCRELAAEFVTWRDVLRPPLVAVDDMFGTFYDELGAAYAYAGGGGLVLFA